MRKRKRFLETDANEQGLIDAAKAKALAIELRRKREEEEYALEQICMEEAEKARLAENKESFKRWSGDTNTNAIVQNQRAKYVHVSGEQIMATAGDYTFSVRSDDEADLTVVYVRDRGILLSKHRFDTVDRMHDRVNEMIDNVLAKRPYRTRTPQLQVLDTGSPTSYQLSDVTTVETQASDGFVTSTITGRMHPSILPDSQEEDVVLSDIFTMDEQGYILDDDENPF